MTTDVLSSTKEHASPFTLVSKAHEREARGYRTFFMLNSVEHEILNAHKYKNIKKSAFLGSEKPRMLFFLLINVKMPTIVVLTFMSRKNFMLSRVEREKVL